EIVVTGKPGDAVRQRLLRVVGEAYVPHKVLVQSGAEGLPLLEGRDPDVAKAYVCRGYVCDAPTDDPETLRSLL
ncbi:MAG TPA: hypothetical protein VLD39_06450, partial [Gammaproteobacteria bacterium]|nr:hypothetical protein [Gammaproteobacteria bacterium]